MKLQDKELFLEKGTETLSEIYEHLFKLPEIALSDLDSKQTVLIILDLINGFTREGALMSPLVEALIPSIMLVSEQCGMRGIQKIAFADSHLEDSPEFDAYPPHCMKGSHEEEIVDEIKEVGGYQLILKNSTNGFLEDEFREWLDQNPTVNNFIITGDCTDICVQQFAITLKTFFNRQNQKARVIVPLSLVDTYDYNMHNALLSNVMACYNMIINGVEVVKDLKLSKE